jgi:hypothetical protein
MTQKTFDPLQRAEAAINAKDYPALITAMEQIAERVPNNPYLAGPLLVIGQTLAEQKDYLPLAVEIAFHYIPPGSELQRQAVDTWAKCASGLFEVSPYEPEMPRTPTPQAAEHFMQKFKL